MLAAGIIGVRSTPNSPKARFHGERPVVFRVGLPTIRSILPRLPEDARRRDIAAASKFATDRRGALPRVSMRLLRGEKTQHRRPPRDLHSSLVGGHCRCGKAEH
jgi:hypothetical protein